MIPVGLLTRLRPFIAEHRAVEADIHGLLADYLDPQFIGPAKKPGSALADLRKNIFSILFLSIYDSVGIPASRRRFYGRINHCIRGLVTATDNILDQEYKEMIPLRFAGNAPNFRSVMHLLLFDRILFRVTEEAVESGWMRKNDQAPLQHRLLQAMVEIGAEEATEEAGVSDILPPIAILRDVHHHKGGNLLRLAFVAPSLVEVERSSRIRLAESGIYSIGLALQVIDDVTDFEADLRDRRHNYLVSWIHHEGTPSERWRLKNRQVEKSGDGTPVEGAYAASVKAVLDQAVGEALRGFSRLNEAGFSVSPRDGLTLIRFLFRVRGLGRLLPLVPRRPTASILVPADAIPA